MIITIISIMITLIISFNFGVLVEQIIEKIDRKTSEQSLSLPIIILLGLFFTSFLLMLIHFFVQINYYVYLLIFTASVFLLFFQRKKCFQILSRKLISPGNQLLALPLLIVSGIILVCHSIDPNYEYDLGLYHLQNIKWFQNCAIVPGLGNLHGRFAFNSNWFLLESLFGNRTIYGQPIFPINIVIIFVFIMYTLDLISQKGKEYISGKTILFILFLSTFTVYEHVNSSSSDKPCDVLIWIILTLFLLKIENKSIKVWDKYSWVIVFLSSFAFTIKVSSVFIFIIPAALYIFSFTYYKKESTYSVLLAGFFISAWVLRNIIISGMVIFPLPVLQMPFLDWSIPKNLVSEMTRIIYLWAIDAYTSRETVAAMSFIEQIILWRSRKNFFFIFILVAGILGSIFFTFIDVITYVKNKEKSTSIKSYLILDAYFVIAIVYWFFSAPDMRFAYGAIFASLSYVIVRIINKIQLSKIFIDAFLLIILFFSVWVAKITIPWETFTQYFFYAPEIPEYSIVEYTLSDGNIIYKPMEDIQCWDAPLPCSGWIYDGLVMRTNQLSDGFRIQK